MTSVSADRYLDCWWRRISEFSPSFNSLFTTEILHNVAPEQIKSCSENSRRSILLFLALSAFAPVRKPLLFWPSQCGVATVPVNTMPHNGLSNWWWISYGVPTIFKEFVCPETSCPFSTAVHETSKRLSQTLRDIYEPEWNGVEDLGVITEVRSWGDFNLHYQIHPTHFTMETYSGPKKSTHTL